MNHLEEIRDFWNLRSHGFSDAVKEELDGGPGKVWTDLFREKLGDEPLDVLDDGAGPGFFSARRTPLTAQSHSPQVR